ncbi:MAG: molybdenum cofactor biosynthesis protein MoaE [Gemmatimonadota bacterium]
MTAHLVREPIDVTSLATAITSSSTGAVSVFVGTVRDNNDGRPVTGIEYSAYDEMAVREISAIIAEAESTWAGLTAVVQHRLGVLGVGEASVVIVTTHAHRGPALDAGRYVIEQLKRRVPIWKLEHYADGEREWVNAARSTAGTGADR